jgi:hypothetical protein
MQPVLVVTADALDSVQQKSVMSPPQAPSLAAMVAGSAASASRPASVAGSVASHHSASEESFSMQGNGRTAAPCGSVLKFLTVAGRQKAERSWKGTLTPRGTTLAAPRLMSKDLGTAATSRPSSARQPTPRTPRPPTAARRNSAAAPATAARHPSEAIPLEQQAPTPEDDASRQPHHSASRPPRPVSDAAGAGMFTDNDEAFERLVNEQGDATERQSDLARVVMSATDLQREIVTACAKARRSNSSVQQELIASALLTHSDVPAPNDPAAMAVAAAAKAPAAAASVGRGHAWRSHSARMHRQEHTGTCDSTCDHDVEDDDDAQTRRRRPHLVASAHLISTPRMRKSEHIHYARPPNARDDLTPRAVHLATPPTVHSTAARPISPNFARKDSEAARQRAEEYKKNAATVSDAVSRSQDVAALALTQQRAMRRNRLGGSGAAGGKGLSFRCLDVPAVDAVAIKTATTPHGGQHKTATPRTGRHHQ